MKKVAKFYWVGLFLLMFLLFLGEIRVTQPHILIISSQTKDSLQTRYLNQGIDEAIAKNRLPVSVLRHYMDLDTLPSRSQMQRKVEEVLTLVRHKSPDVVIVAGHDANNLLATQLGIVDPNMWIVPVAISINPEDFGYTNKSRLVGVIRRLPFVGIADFIKTIDGNKATHAAIIGGDTYGNKRRVDSFKDSPPGNIQLGDMLLSNCWDEWQTFISKQKKSTDMLLVLPTPRLEDHCTTRPEIIARQTFIPWIEQNSVPLPISTDGNFVKDGGAVSFYPSYQEEGQLAMGLALSLIDSSQHEKPKPIYSDAYQIALRDQRLAKRHISAPSVYIEYGQKSGLNYRDSD